MTQAHGSRARGLWVGRPDGEAADKHGTGYVRNVPYAVPMSSVVAVSGVLAINGILGILTLIALVAEVIAFVDSLTHPPAAYVAASKQTKVFWTILLGVAALLTLATKAVLGIFGLIGAVAVIVYFVDVRPALRATRGGRSDRHQGPYGPW